MTWHDLRRCGRRVTPERLLVRRRSLPFGGVAWPAGPAIVPVGLSALASMEASSPSAMFFLKDLMPFAKSPIRLLTLPPPNSSNTTSSTTIQCQMLKLPISPPSGLVAAPHRLRTLTGAPCQCRCSQRPLPTTWRDAAADASAFRDCHRLAATGAGHRGFFPAARRIDCEGRWRRVSSPFGRQYRPYGNNKDGLLPQGWERRGLAPTRSHIIGRSPA